MQEMRVRMEAEDGEAGGVPAVQVEGMGEFSSDARGAKRDC